MLILPMISRMVIPKAYTSFFFDTIPSAIYSGATYPLNSYEKMK
jgi:hypothetical protein